MQRPQLALLRLQSRPEDVNFGVNNARLAPQPAGYAAVADEAGLLRYLKLDNRAFSTESVYQLQYGSELVYCSREPVELPCMIDRPWTAFEFIPYTARAILFHQSGSNKLLYSTLPDAQTASSPVLLFGSHTGLISCFSVSAAGRHVVSGSAVGAIKLWSLKEGVQLDMQEAAHPAGVSALAFLEPAVVLSGGAKGGVCIWEVHQQKLLARQRLDTGPSAVGSLAGLQPTSVNQTSMLDKQRAMPWQHALTEPDHQAEAVYVVAGTDAGMLHVWAASGAGQDTWQPVATPQQGTGHAVKALSFSPDGSLLAVAAGTGVGHIWLYSTNDWSCRRMEGGLLQPPLACCFCDWAPLSHQAAHLFVAPGPTAAAQCLPVPTVTKVSAWNAQPPVPPYLHYQDPADEEDSCPQPSALPAALAASLPAVHKSQAAGHHYFHFHPPLPPHPLLKLHRPAVDSPTHRAPSPGHVASSPSHGHSSPAAQRCSPSRPADCGSLCKGPGASSRDGTSQADSPDSLPHAVGSASVPGAPVLHSSNQQQVQQHKPQTADFQQQQSGVVSAQLSGNEDRLRPVASSPEAERDEAITEEQEQSDFGSQGSQVSDCSSTGAVGDDELLDHEPAITDSAAETQESPVNQPGHNSQLQIHRQRDSTYSAEQGHAGSIPRPPGQSSMVTQHEQEFPRATPQHFGDRGIGQQQRTAALPHPQQWPYQATAPIARHGQMQHGLGRGGREVHVIHEGSKLRAAYRGHCQQDDQRSAEAEQQLVQHGQRQDSGANCQSRLQAVHIAEEVANKAANEAADQQPQCFAQSSMEAVPQPMPASHIPVRMKVPKQLYVRPLASADKLTDQPAFHSRTAAGQYWTAGGQHPREPLCDIQPTAAAPVPALTQPQTNSSALLAATIDRLQGEEFDAAAVLQDPDVQKRVASAAAVAANVPRDAHLYRGLQSLHEVVVPVEAPKLVPKQLHPAWVAKQHLKPELADLWTAKEQYRAVLTTDVLPRHVKLSRGRVAESLLRFC